MSEASTLTQEGSEVQRELLLKYGIEQHVSQLVKLGATAVRTLQPQAGHRTAMEESQFRNLLNVALETSSVDVITNFIRYQIGRSPNVWGRGAKDFGPTLIRDIETGEVYKAAEHIKQDLGQKVGADHVDEVFQRAYLRLTRLYLGYAMRVFYFCKKREEDKDENAWDNLFRPEEG